MRRKEEYKQNTHLNFITKLLLFCAIILIPICIMYITCSLDTVIVEGSIHYTEAELKEQILTKRTDGNTILFYLRQKYGKQESIPFVSDIDIKIVNRNTVKVKVYEKAVIGCIKYMNNYMYFDKDGIVVETSNEKLENIPFIRGLKFSSFVLYKKLEVEKEELFSVILKLTQLIQKFELEVDTIQFNDEAQVTLVSGDNKIFLGKRDSYDEQLAELKNLLPTAKGKKLIIDMENFEEGQKKTIAKPIN